MVGVVVMASALAHKTVSCAAWTTNVCLAAGCLKDVINDTTFII